MDEINLEDIDVDEITSTIESFQNNDVQPGSEVPTDTPTQPDQVQQPSTEGQENRPGALGFVQDVAEGTIKDLPQNLYEGVAPAVGIVDTMTDAFNMATGFNVPKLPEYEDKTSSAVRGISGLVIPLSLIHI